MTSGLSNAQKSKVRQQYAEGEVGRDELLDAEAAAYHGPGTCTFYGTANSNQMLMELMGLHLPGASFVNPNTPLRNALTEAAGRARPSSWQHVPPIADIVDEKAVVNGVVGAAGHRRVDQPHPAPGRHGPGRGHRPALGRLRRPLGRRAAARPDLPERQGRREPLPRRGRHGVPGARAARRGPPAPRRADRGRAGAATPTRPSRRSSTAQLVWRDGPAESLDLEVLRPVDDPFDKDGGLRMLAGNLGRAVIKTSAVAPEHRLIEAPARVFDDQDEFQAAFEAGELDDDFVAVVRYQGPKANGMPELHKLTPPLGVLQDRGHRVALVTDGRMSGASGKIPAAIHVTPEAAADASPIARLRDGDLVRLDADAGTIEVLVDRGRVRRPPGRRPAGPRVRRHRPGAVRVLPPRRRPGRRGRQHLRRGRMSSVSGRRPRHPGRGPGGRDPGRAAGPRPRRGRSADHRADPAHALGAGGGPADRGRGARGAGGRGHDPLRPAGATRPPRRARSSSSARAARPPCSTRWTTPGCPTCPGRRPSRRCWPWPSAGHTAMKFFPAEAAGGAPYLASLASPLPHLRFCPTGGITAATAGQLPAAAERRLRRRLLADPGRRARRGRLGPGHRAGRGGRAPVAV